MEAELSKEIFIQWAQITNNSEYVLSIPCGSGIVVKTSTH